VTRFECGSLRKLLYLMVLHHRVKRDVRRQAKGFVAGRMIVDWRDRVLLSVTIWQDLRSLYSMGGVPRHVIAARVPRQLGVATVSGVFCFVGDWKRVLFRADTAPRSPLAPTVPETNREDNNNA
jgi:hypothetical protein